MGEASAFEVPGRYGRATDTLRRTSMCDKNCGGVPDAADDVHRDTMMSDETWASLSDRYDTHQMMSVAATLARYPLTVVDAAVERPACTRGSLRQSSLEGG